MTDDNAEPDDRLAKLTPGSSIRVSDLSDALGGYWSSVVDASGQFINIEIPIRRDGMLSLSVGQLVSVRFDRPGDAVYLFDTVVAEVRDDERAPYALARPVVIDQRPHRADVRLALVLEAEYQLTDEGRDEVHFAKVVDLSAGGIGLITDREHEIGDELHVKVRLPGPDDVLDVESTVTIRSRTIYGRTPSGAVLNLYGLQFTDVSNQVRDRILATVIWNLTQNPAVL